VRCENGSISFIQKPCGKNNVDHQHRFASYSFGWKSHATRNGSRGRESSLIKIVLTDIAKRLEVKEKKFSVYTAASADELDDLWVALLSIDKEFLSGVGDKSVQRNLVGG